MIQQIKHEIGHVQFRVLRDSRTGQNSLQLSGSTGALPRENSACPCVAAEGHYPKKQNAKAVTDSLWLV
jgi:hypothetical protein